METFFNNNLNYFNELKENNKSWRYKLFMETDNKRINREYLYEHTYVNLLNSQNKNKIAFALNNVSH